MTVRRTRYGTWEARVWYKGRERSKSFRSRDLAKAWEAKTKLENARVIAGIPAPRRRVTVRAFCDEWLTGAHNLAPSSIRIYRQSLDPLLDEIGDMMLDQLDKRAIDRAFAAYRASTTRLGGPPAASSQHRSYRGLGRMLRVAVEAELLDRSPLRAVDPPVVVKDSKRYLTVDELEALATVIDSRYRTWVLVAGWGGLRWGELAGLRHSDVDYRSGRVHVQGQLTSHGWKPWTKGKKDRWVDVPPSVVAELDPVEPSRAGPDRAETYPAASRRAMSDSGYVWTMPRGAPLDHSRFRQRFWLPAVRKAKLEPLHPHNLRDTAVALAVAAGAHPAEIQAQLGHTSIQTTLDEYGGLFEASKREVATKLDELRSKARRLRAV